MIRLGRMGDIMSSTERFRVDQMAATKSVAVPGRTAPETRPEPKKKGGVGKGVRNAIIAGAALTTLGGAVIETVPQLREAVHRSIGLRGGEVPSTFESNAEKITIGNNNLTRITPEKAEREGLLIPQFNPDTKVFTLPFLFIPLEGTTTTLDRSEYEVRTIKHSEPRITVPAGTGVIIPEGMHYRLIGGHPDLKEDPNLVYGLAAVKYDKKNNITTILSFNLWDETKQEMVPLSTDLAITPAKDAYGNWDSIGIDYWEKFSVSDGIKPIATTSNQLIHVTVEAFNGNRLDAVNKIEDTQIQWQQQNGKLLILDTSNH